MKEAGITLAWRNSIKILNSAFFPQIYPLITKSTTEHLLFHVIYDRLWDRQCT